MGLELENKVRSQKHMRLGTGQDVRSGRYVR